MGPPLRELTGVFLRAGNLTFGGGDPTVAALHRELTARRGWLTQDHFGLAYSLARITPGTNLLAFCAGAAWFLRGWPAAVAAVLAVTVPSAVLVVWLTHAYEFSRTNALAAGAIAGVLAAAVGMMVAAAWVLARPHLGGRRTARTLFLVLVPAALTWKFAVSPVYALVLAALAGFFWKETGE
jgi:chromate transporter